MCKILLLSDLTEEKPPGMSGGALTSSRRRHLLRERRFEEEQEVPIRVSGEGGGSAGIDQYLNRF